MEHNFDTQINIQVQNNQINYIDLVPCTLEHFLPLFEKYSVDFREQFEQQNLQNFLCPNLNFIHSLNMTVGGVWASTDYYFLKFSVTNCRDSSQSNFTWKPKCKTSDEIQSTLNTQGSFRFQVYTTNFLINPNRPKDYIQPYLAVDQFYTFVPDKMFVQSDIFFRTKKVTTDTSCSQQQTVKASQCILINKMKHLLLEIMEIKENNLKFQELLLIIMVHFIFKEVHILIMQIESSQGLMNY